MSAPCIHVKKIIVLFIFDGLVKSPKTRFSVIPVKTGIQGFQWRVYRRIYDRYPEEKVQERMKGTDLAVVLSSKDIEGRS